jgi:arylsulfatase A-like enzyme
MNRLSLLVALAVAGSACDDGGEPPHILLITVDTLRADRLGAYGSETTRTPHIDRLAREGVLFERAVAPIPVTKPSHFSMFTSLYPRDHGVMNNRMRLPEELPTLAGVLQRGGYDTAAFTATALLDRESGAGRGFGEFFRPKGSSRDADRVVPQADKWLRQRRSERPFFVWVHLFDPHMPYAPPHALRPASSPDMEHRLPVADWAPIAELARENGGDLPQAALERVVGLYDGEVEHVDRWIGTLRQALEDRGWLDRTVVVFTADHGECFENGVFFYHSNCLYEPAVRVPLLLRYPKQLPAGERRGDVVENLDLAPTLLTLAGLEIPGGFVGGDLFAPRAEGGRAFVQHPLYPDRTLKARRSKLEGMTSVAGEAVVPLVVGVQQTAVRTRDWKLIQTGSETELYDLVSDPGERRNVAVEQPEVASELLGQLEQWQEDHPLEVGSPAAVNEELIEHLRALGYVQ